LELLQPHFLRFVDESLEGGAPEDLEYASRAFQDGLLISKYAKGVCIMWAPFEEGDIDGDAEEACGKGVVETGREESADVGESEAFRRTCGEKAASDAGRGSAEGDETGDSISID
jgi:hypothetical protein